MKFFRITTEELKNDHVGILLTSPPPSLLVKEVLAITE
jgi:hypothetical protein